MLLHPPIITCEEILLSAGGKGGLSLFERIVTCTFPLPHRGPSNIDKCVGSDIRRGICRTAVGESFFFPRLFFFEETNAVTASFVNV